MTNSSIYPNVPSTQNLYAPRPLIHQGLTISEQVINQGSDKEKLTQGEVMVWFLWDCQVDSIIDVKLGDADTDSYKYEPMAALLTWW